MKNSQVTLRVFYYIRTTHVAVVLFYFEYFSKHHLAILLIRSSGNGCS